MKKAMRVILHREGDNAVSYQLMPEHVILSRAHQHPISKEVIRKAQDSFRKTKKTVETMEVILFFVWVLAVVALYESFKYSSLFWFFFSLGTIVASAIAFAFCNHFSQKYKLISWERFGKAQNILLKYISRTHSEWRITTLEFA